MADTGYAPGSPPATNSGLAPAYNGSDLGDLKADYEAFLGGKVEEIKEQKDARRYYHSAQWTEKQVKALNRRRQPVVTYNHEAKKINSVVGLLARQRSDPKAYPRTDAQADGAEIATACIRYVVDQQQWEAKDALCTLDAAVDAIAGVELQLVEGDSGKPGDYDISFDKVAPSTFFYDPRSLEADFSDARYMGVAKWADVDLVCKMFPDLEDDIRASVASGTELTTNPDSDNKWMMTEKGRCSVRLVDHWYLDGDEWKWCLYTGLVKLREGPSPYRDEKDNSTCKFIMWSANVDHDGDRYGFHRNMKSSQDEINQRRSKGLHIANSRRIIVRDGQGLDVEKIRREAARPDGVLVIPPGAEIPTFDDVARGAELQAQLGFLAEAKAELESGQFNPEAVGNSETSLSGRAIQLRQQAGIAELGPFRIAYRGWKLRLYRAIWNAIRRFWTAERAIRVTDNPQAPAMIPINKLGLHPQTGMPAIINNVNSLDVDIILDEGPDTITMQQANAEALQALGQSGIQVPPMLAILLSDLDPSVKKEAEQIIQQASQPGPVQQQGIALDMQTKQAKNAETMSKARLNMAKAGSESAPQGGTDPAQIALDRWKTLVEAFTQIKVAEIAKGADADASVIDGQIDAFLGLSGLASDQVMQLRDHAHQKAMLALQPPPQPAQAA